MTAPEEAVARAREAAAQMRAAGAYAQAGPSREGPSATETSELKLYQWAFIDPDVTEVRSTRRFGAPVTAVKKLLLRMLGQYHAQLIGEQTRFNVTLLGHVQRLAARIQELEDQLSAEHEDR